MQPVVLYRYLPLQLLHQLADGDVILGGYRQMEMIPHDNEGMELHPRDGIEDYLSRIHRRMLPRVVRERIFWM